MDLFALKSLVLLLSVTGCRADLNILPAGPVDVVLGRDVTVKTLLSNPSFLMIIWNYSDGKDQTRVATLVAAGLNLNVNDPYEGRVSINSTTGHLTLKSVTAADSGDYSINIILSDGDSRTAEIKVRVLEPVSAVAIRSNLPEAIEHNSTVVLNCSAKGSYLIFTWTNGTTPIVADGKRVTLKHEDLSSTLTIAGVLRSDLVGPIYCTATNPLEKEKSGPFNLTVFYGPEEVVISPPKPPQYIKSKSDFNLTCAARSSPHATFTWYHNEDMIEHGDAILPLKVIEAQGYGDKLDEYTCRANNAKTKRTVPSPGVSFATMEAISGVKITGPTSVLIAGNSSANLSCQATAGAVKTKVWLKDGKPLAAGPRVAFASDKSSMSINLLQKEDNGKYTCQLSNPINTDEAVFKMVVNFGPEPAMVTGDDFVEVNTRVILTCAAMSVPAANFTWKFNGTMTNIKTAQYTIENAAYRNSGTYTCEAKNPITGKATSHTHTMAVKEDIDDGGLSDGAIAGIVIAVLVALAAAIGLIFYCRQKVPVESPY